MADSRQCRARNDHIGTLVSPHGVKSYGQLVCHGVCVSEAPASRASVATRLEGTKLEVPIGETGKIVDLKSRRRNHRSFWL